MMWLFVPIRLYFSSFPGWFHTSLNFKNHNLCENINDGFSKVFNFKSKPNLTAKKHTKTEEPNLPAETNPIIDGHQKLSKNMYSNLAKCYILFGQGLDSWSPDSTTVLSSGYRVPPLGFCWLAGCLVHVSLVGGVIGTD